MHQIPLYWKIMFVSFSKSHNMEFGCHFFELILRVRLYYSRWTVFLYSPITKILSVPHSSHLEYINDVQFWKNYDHSENREMADAQGAFIFLKDVFQTRNNRGSFFWAEYSFEIFVYHWYEQNIRNLVKSWYWIPIRKLWMKIISVFGWHSIFIFFVGFDF